MGVSDTSHRDGMSSVSIGFCCSSCGKEFKSYRVSANEKQGTLDVVDRGRAGAIINFFRLLLLFFASVCSLYLNYAYHHVWSLLASMLDSSHIVNTVSYNRTIQLAFGFHEIKSTTYKRHSSSTSSGLVGRQHTALCYTWLIDVTVQTRGAFVFWRFAGDFNVEIRCFQARIELARMRSNICYKDVTRQEVV